MMQRFCSARAIGYLLLALASDVYGTQTPTEQKIELLRSVLEKRVDYKTHNDLARALVIRVRESGDVAYHAEAERALAQSRKIVPDNLESGSIAVSILLSKREFTAALDRARALNKKVPDDLEVYGHIVVAAVALGKYGEAEQAAQWMLDLRSFDIRSLTHAAYLREVFGDTEGAINLMQSVYPRIPPQDIEARAWHLTRMASMFAGAGKTAAAEGNALAALKLFPDYPHALEQLARVRSSQGRFVEAVALALKRTQLISHPESNYALARALAAAGKEKDAKLAFAEFERTALARTHQADNANNALIAFYIDYARKPAQALIIADREIERRRDADTLAAYVWALYVNGKRAQARQELQTAIASGVCRAVIVERAKVIAAKPGEQGFVPAQQRCSSACCGAL